MNTTKTHIEPLFEQCEQFTNTSIDLLKLQTTSKVSYISSVILSQLINVITMMVFIITLNISIALLIDHLLGSAYIGFFIVASFYAFLSILIFILYPTIRSKINNALIVLFLNKN